jgi:hypothetical protein
MVHLILSPNKLVSGKPPPSPRCALLAIARRDSVPGQSRLLLFPVAVSKPSPNIRRSNHHGGGEIYTRLRQGGTAPRRGQQDASRVRRPGLGCQLKLFPVGLTHNLHGIRRQWPECANSGSRGNRAFQPRSVNHFTLGQPSPAHRLDRNTLVSNKNPSSHENRFTPG